MTEKQQRELVQQALDTRLGAYAPYSHFQVGAALLTDDGRVFTGANVENASYGLTICAERVAATAAVSAGEKDFRAIAIASPGGVPPCGACRQFLVEFCRDLKVVLVDSNNADVVHETNLAELLPNPFVW